MPAFNEELDSWRVQFPGRFLKAAIIGTWLGFENGSDGFGVPVSGSIEQSRPVIYISRGDFGTALEQLSDVVRSPELGCNV